MSPTSSNLRAAFLMVSSVTAFCVGDAFIKDLGARLPTGQIMAVRGMMMLPLFLLVLPRIGLRSGRPDRWAVIRGVCEIGVALAFLTALRTMPLGDTYTLYFSAPVLLTAVVAVTGAERVGVQRWLAVLAGFGGILIAAGPSASWSAVVFLPLLAAVLSVARDLATRRVDPAVGAATVSMVSASMLMLAGFASLPAGWAPIDARDLAFCAVAAVGATAGYVLFVVGLRMGELSFVAPLRYAALPIAMLLDLLVWGVFPDGRMVLGAAVIIASGLFVLLSERRADERHAAAGQG